MLHFFKNHSRTARNYIVTYNEIENRKKFLAPGAGKKLEKIIKKRENICKN